jgi:hypothetical protein
MGADCGYGVGWMGKGGGENRTYADDALGADELDELVGYASLGVALTVCLEVAQVANVAGLVLGGAVVLAVGVDCTCMSSGYLCTPTIPYILIPAPSQKTGWEQERGMDRWRKNQVRHLQCGPALVHPFVLSPKAWTCMPRSALASLPVMFHEMVVWLDSFSCSKVTVPLTLESPRRTATVFLALARAFSTPNSTRNDAIRFPYVPELQPAMPDSTVPQQRPAIGVPPCPPGTCTGTKGSAPLANTVLKPRPATQSRPPHSLC